MTLDRRSFLAGLGAGTLGLQGMTLPPFPPFPPFPTFPAGIQLYTLRSLMRTDFEGTLAALAEMGYREVEFAGTFGRSGAQVKAILDRLGLRAPAQHVGLDAFQTDAARVLEEAAAMGNQYVIVAWIPADMRRTLREWRQTAEQFNRIGAAAAAAGIQFGYHNHDYEFTPVEGRIPFDVLLEETDRDRVRYELDLFWIAKGGQDPAAYLERHAGRFQLTHVKDMAADGSMVDPGAGVMDFARLLPLAWEKGVRHYFIEHDEPGDALATARAGVALLNRLSS